MRVDYLYVGFSLVPPVKPTRVLTTPAAQPNWAWQSEIFSATFHEIFSPLTSGNQNQDIPKEALARLAWLLVVITRLSDLCFLQSYETLDCRQWSRRQLTVSVKFDCVAAPHKLETVDLYSTTVRIPYYSPLTE